MRRNDLARKITSWLTLGVFSLQPSLSFAADIVADASAPEAQRPYVTETASGVPLVQIARPDGGDVSVNRYEAFSVPERGAILKTPFSSRIRSSPDTSRETRILAEAPHASS